MAYVLIENDYDADIDNAWKNVVDEFGRDLVFASLDELREWVSVNRKYPDSVRSIEVSDDY